MSGVMGNRPQESDSILGGAGITSSVEGGDVVKLVRPDVNSLKLLALLILKLFDRISLEKFWTRTISTA